MLFHNGTDFMTAKIPLFRELSAQAVLTIVFFKKKCRLVGETGLKLLDLFEVKFHFHLVEHKMPYVAVGMDLDSTPEKNSVPTIIVFIDQRSFSMVLMTFAGTPPTKVLSGTSSVTTAPAATTAFRPIVTPGQMVAPMQIQAFSLMVTFPKWNRLCRSWRS